jgi:hypothetical protein
LISGDFLFLLDELCYSSKRLKVNLEISTYFIAEDFLDYLILHIPGNGSSMVFQFFFSGTGG